MTTRQHSHLFKYHPIEHLVSLFRFNKVSKYIKDAVLLLDVGCGYNGNLLNYFSGRIKQGFGIDFVVNENNNGKIKLVSSDLDNNFFPPLPKFDVVTCLSVLEHVNRPENVLKNIYESLKESGILLLIVPTWKSKPVVEFAAFKLKIISREEIMDHKRYFDKEEIKDLVKKTGFKEVIHKYFQFGLNNLIVARK